VAQKGKNYLLIFPDFHFYIRNTENGSSQRLIRLLKWLHSKVKHSKCTVIFISNSEQIPNEISDMIDVELIRPPDDEELQNLLKGILISPELSEIKISEDIRFEMIKSALGLSLNQAERLFNLAIVREFRNPEKMVNIIVQGKKGIIAASGALEFFAPDELPDYLAGVEFLKEWINRRKEFYSEEAENYKLPRPKGVFLLGIPGTGKSLTAKFIAGKWHMPLLRLDIGALYSSYVGATEQSLRQALHLVEATAPAILWIDEIEKAFVSGGGNLDAGVSNRVLGSFLTWMQENTAPVFVVATANNVDELPPELMRKGRFDEIFFLDLPNPEEREAIFEVHIQNNGRDPNNFNIDELVENTEQYVGAEIEQVIKEALYIAFADNHREMEHKDLLSAIKNTKPLAETKKAMIDKLRQKVERREAVLASKVPRSSQKKHTGGLELN
jgi:SpoVK/Ycf46/Vps4 family AAA+-type ATPase